MARFILPLVLLDLLALPICGYAYVYAAIEEPFYGDWPSSDDVFFIHALPAFWLGVTILLHGVLLQRVGREAGWASIITTLLVSVLCVGISLLPWFGAIAAYESDRVAAREMRAEYEGQLSRK